MQEKSNFKEYYKRLRGRRFKHEDAEDIAQEFVIKNLLSKKQSLSQCSIDWMRTNLGSYRRVEVEKICIDYDQITYTNPENLYEQKEQFLINLNKINASQKRLIKDILNYKNQKKLLKKLGVTKHGLWYRLRSIRKRIAGA